MNGGRQWTSFDVRFITSTRIGITKVDVHLKMFYKILQNGNIIHDNDCLQYGLYTVHAIEDSPKQIP